MRRAVWPLLGALVVALLVGVVLVFSSTSVPVVPEVVGARPAGASPAEVRGTWPVPKAEVRGTGPVPEAEVRGTGPVPEAEVRGTRPVPEAEVRGTWPVPKPEVKPFTVADATGAQVHLFSAPGVPLADKATMANPTWEGLAVVFLVLDQQPGWLQVRVSSRPNSMVAWVETSEVSLRQVPNHVRIEVAARRVTVMHGDDVLLQAPVAVGNDATPTPLGSFFVDGIVSVANSGGPYGPFQVSVSGFSNVYSSFGGGVGQIAMHGTNRPALIGQAISNGCVRMDNTVIAQMADLAPTGTPVEIVA